MGVLWSNCDVGIIVFAFLATSVVSPPTFALLQDTMAELAKKEPQLFPLQCAPEYFVKLLSGG